MTESNLSGADWKTEDALQMGHFLEWGSKKYSHSGHQGVKLSIIILSECEGKSWRNKTEGDYFQFQER